MIKVLNDFPYPKTGYLASSEAELFHKVILDLLQRVVGPPRSQTSPGILLTPAISEVSNINIGENSIESLPSATLIQLPQPTTD